MATDRSRGHQRGEVLTSIGGSASIRPRACGSGMAAGNTPPRMAPRSRMWMTSARVSTPLIAGTPQSVSQSQPAALRAR